MVMTHEPHIYAKSYDTSKATICAYTQSNHELPHWIYVMQCCAECPCVNLPYQETYDQYSDTSPSIIFHIYHLIARCTTHGRLILIHDYLEDRKSVEIVMKPNP